MEYITDYYTAFSAKYQWMNDEVEEKWFIVTNYIIENERRYLILVDKDENHYFYHITIYEGRNREIRKMFEFLELKIYSLKRLQIGGLTLGNLEEGKYKYLDKKEINRVFEGE